MKTESGETTADLSCVALQPEKWPSGVLQKEVETISLELRPSHIAVLTFSQPSWLSECPACRRNLQHLVKSTPNFSARVSIWCESLAPGQWDMPGRRPLPRHVASRQQRRLERKIN